MVTSDIQVFFEGGGRGFEKFLPINIISPPVRTPAIFWPKRQIHQGHQPEMESPQTKKLHGNCDTSRHTWMSQES